MTYIYDTVSKAGFLHKLEQLHHLNRLGLDGACALYYFLNDMAEFHDKPIDSFYLDEIVSRFMQFDSINELNKCFSTHYKNTKELKASTSVLYVQDKLNLSFLVFTNKEKTKLEKFDGFFELFPENLNE
jgi:hypothetical protein